MSKDSKRSSSERLKYGICLNDECSLCKSKQVQSVPMRKELICSECGKELRECPPPKKKSKTSIAIIIATIIIALIEIYIFARLLCFLPQGVPHFLHTKSIPLI